MRWLTYAGLAFAAAVTLLGVAAGIGHARWRRESERAFATLRSDAARGARDTFSEADLAGVPEPVARYFRFALEPGRPHVTHARFEQAGEFASRPGAWMPFVAVEEFSVRPPGFVWDARVRMAPLLYVHVRDSYVGGTGTMHGAVAGLATVVDAHGTAELTSGALLRWLAELPWLPTALLPASGVRWDAVDGTRARATFRDGATEVSMLVEFAADGSIARITADRHRDVDGTQVLTRWEGRHGEYRRIDGMMVPTWSEVGWLLPEGYTPYWRGGAVASTYR